ncbi:MAG TPA: NAD(P)-binding protein [Kofleriaceae bacterium]|jgi:protoporphyrinogen oxidase
MTHDDADVVVIGAGISGLGFANWWRELHPGERVVVLEADVEPGGYCRTIERAGFVWDYSGHFFHFRDPALEAWLRARMPGEDVRSVERVAKIRYAGIDIDFPFQLHIHQLPKEELVECLVELYFRPSGDDAPRSFGEMLYRRLGKGITDKFLRPYNEKLYATSLDALDPDAMGRFFPHADLADVIANMRAGKRAHGYNATFTYPAGGAARYVNALLRDLPSDCVACNEPALAIDRAARTVTTPQRTLHYKRVVSSAPLPQLARIAGATYDAGVFTSNRVLVFNLGFDAKGPRDIHWMYFPDPAIVFYRVGWYDNILGGDRMSLYVEIGAPNGSTFDGRDPRPTGSAAEGRRGGEDVAALQARVLDDLVREGIVTDQRLVASHHVVLDPAYVHITRASLAETARLRAELAADGIHSVGRYGGWTYCSIEDNLLETRALAKTLSS